MFILTLTLLQKSLQQDPSHDGPGAEEDRRGSDVVEERAERDSSSEEEEVSSRPVTTTRASPRKHPPEEGRKTPPTPPSKHREEASSVAGAVYSQSDDTPLLDMCCHSPCNREENEEKLECANELCKDKDTGKPREVHMSCYLAQTIVKEYNTRTPGRSRGRGSRCPYLEMHAFCPKCTKGVIKEWVQTDDGKKYVSENKERLTRLNLIFKS